MNKVDVTHDLTKRHLHRERKETGGETLTRPEQTIEKDHAGTRLQACAGMVFFYGYCQNGDAPIGDALRQACAAFGFNPLSQPPRRMRQRKMQPRNVSSVAMAIHTPRRP